MEFLRRRLGLISRLLVSALLVGWLVHLVNWSRLGAIVVTMHPGWLLAAFFCFLPVMLIVSWRWRMLLRVQDIALSYGRVLEFNMIGQFFSGFLIGTTGGDVFRIFYVARAAPGKRVAVAVTVLLDRVIGMLALLMVGSAFSVTQLPLLFSRHETRLATGTFFLFVLGGIGVIVLACLTPLLGRFQGLRELLGRLPFVHIGSSLFQAYLKSIRAFGTNILALVGSLPSHFCMALMGYCIMRAMHARPPLIAFCAILSIVNMLIALPVSISGIGFREVLFAVFLGLIGVDQNHAVAFSLTFFGLTLAWSLAGGPFYLLYRQEVHVPLDPRRPRVPEYSSP